jgi:two-component system NtrC family sensor kinase
VALAPPNGGPPVALLALRDIRQRRAAEDEIHGLYREFALLHLVRERIGLERDPEAIADQVLDALFKILDRQAGALLFLDDEAGLRLAARRRVAPAVLEALAAGGPPAALLAEVIAGRREVRLDGPGTLPEPVRAALVAAGVRALLCLPLRSPGRVHGVLALCATEPDPFSSADADLLAAVAGETGLVLETARLERQLRGSEQRYRAMIEQSPLGILEVSVGGTVLWANAAAARIVARAPEALVGLPAVELYANAGDRDQLIADLAARGVLLDRPVEWRRPDGRPLWVSLTSRRVPAGGDRPERFEDVIRDVTEERELQERLLRTEKLASLGQMISGIAHELNNPLTGVLGYAQLLQEAEIPADIREDVEKISADAMRCKRIIENLMRFARKERPRRGVVHVNEEIEAVLELRRYQLEVADVRVERELAPNLPYTMADPHQLQQVILNLINNAADAIKDARGHGTLRVASGLHAGRLRVSVSDDGTGIAPATLPRIFDPFFTTKEVGKGTGLGLSVSYGIVREHGGEIQVESEPGQGTTFHVDLPVERITPPAERARDTTRRLRVGGRGARVLVVGGDAAALAVTLRTLDDDGYRTTGAASLAEAQARLASEPLEAVVAELTLPDGDAAALLASLQGPHPMLARRLVVLVAEEPAGSVRAWLEQAGVAWLRRPFRVRELRKLVRRVIDEA